jgi:hypothetical protein
VDAFSSAHRRGVPCCSLRLIDYPRGIVISESAPDSIAKVRAEHPSLELYLRDVLTSEQVARPLIVSFNQWEMNTVAVGEIAATLHTMGSRVAVALWAGETPLPDIGWTTSHALATAFASPTRDQRLRRALLAFGLPRTAFPGPPIPRWKPVAQLPSVTNFNRTAIRALNYREAAMGRAILQVHPDADTPVTDDHVWPRAWVEANIKSFAWAYDQTRALIDRTRATALVVFNSRFLHDGAAAGAAEHAGIPVLSFDFGGNDTDIDLTIEATHDWSALQRRMLALYQSWDPESRDAIGGSWFEERRQHADPRNALFVESQTVGTGIEKPKGAALVVFFSSSGDEISELDLDWNEYFLGQPGALLALAEVCRELPATILLVRTHPHKRFKPQRDVEDWHAAVAQARPAVHLDEFSEVDSYTLMRQADVVVTYGSTTGVEAAYAGKPVIVMGPSAYDELGCATRVTTVQELRDALVAAEPGDWSSAVSFGLMMRRRGFMFRHIQRCEGKLLLAGVVLRDSREFVLKMSDLLGSRRRSRLVR